MAVENHIGTDEKARLSEDEALHEQAPRDAKDKIGLWITVAVAIAVVTWLAFDLPPCAGALI